MRSFLIELVLADSGGISRCSNYEQKDFHEPVSTADNLTLLIVQKNEGGLKANVTAGKALLVLSHAGGCVIKTVRVSTRSDETKENEEIRNVSHAYPAVTEPESLVFLQLIYKKNINAFRPFLSSRMSLKHPVAPEIKNTT